MFKETQKEHEWTIVCCWWLLFISLTLFSIPIAILWGWWVIVSIVAAVAVGIKLVFKMDDYQYKWNRDN